MGANKGGDWPDAARRCRLNEEEIRMAKALGFQPRTLIKNIPGPSQQWKAPVREWVRSLYEEKFGRAEAGQAPPSAGNPSPAAGGSERRDARDPWPDRPAILPLRPLPEFEADEDAFDESFFGLPDLSIPPTEEEAQEEDALMLRRQFLFRCVAQFLAHAFARLPEVEKVAAFGSVARPLKKEVPRFTHFRRHRVAIYHECGDLDLAVWVTSFDRLNELRRTLSRTVGLVDFEGCQVAHHQVDLHLFESVTGAYRGRLCIFGECPKPGKRECLTPGCGASPFLQQFEDLVFRAGRFQAESKVILFDRASGFLVHEPAVRAPEPGPGLGGLDTNSDDVPF